MKTGGLFFCPEGRRDGGMERRRLPLSVWKRIWVNRPRLPEVDDLLLRLVGSGGPVDSVELGFFVQSKK